MNKKIYLKIDKINLGYLIESFGGYTFCANEDGIEKAEQKHMIAMKLFNLNKSGCCEYVDLPYEYAQFMPSTERSDIYEKAKISYYDSDFEKLFKIAGINHMPINFYLAQNE